MANNNRLPSWYIVTSYCQWLTKNITKARKKSIISGHVRIVEPLYRGRYFHFFPITPGFIADMDLGHDAVHSRDATVLRCTFLLKSRHKLRHVNNWLKSRNSDAPRFCIKLRQFRRQSGCGSCGYFPLARQNRVHMQIFAYSGQLEAATAAPGYGTLNDWSNRETGIGVSTSVKPVTLR